MPHPQKLALPTILDAAWTLLETGGPDALSMRPLADALGVRAGSLYRHIGSREELLRRVAARAALALQIEMRSAADGLPPRAALESASAAYLSYALSHPHVYALLLLPEPAGERAADPGAAKALWNTLLALVGALSGDPDDTDHAVALWTFLHGAASLERAGLYGTTGPRGGLQVGLGALLDHMEAQGQGAQGGG